jgi:hypothetical protein
MPEFSNPTVLKSARVHMWVDKIIQNLESLENDLFSEDYDKVKLGLQEQYRLIFILRDAKQGKTVLQGWKTESSNSTGE